MSSLPSSLPKPRGQQALSTHRRPNLSCAAAEGEQRLSKQELVRQQIVQETFPNELERLVPSPRAVALPPCLARQCLALAGGPTLCGGQRSRAGSGTGKLSSCPSASLRQRGKVEEEDASAYQGANSSIGALAMADATGGAPSCV